MGSSPVSTLSNDWLISPLDVLTDPAMGHQRQLPGGRYRITSQENALFCTAIGSTPDLDGRAHPVFYYIATQAAMGVSVAELCAICDFDVADGPMMAQSRVDFDTDLMVDLDYLISGEIVSLVRKPSRTFGALDLLTYRLVASDMSGNRVAQCTNQWILPRRGAVTT